MKLKPFGIKTGTKTHETKRLCPGLVCVLASHECYVEFHHRLIEEIEQHIPVTAVCSIDEVACRLMDNENSLERSTAIARAIKNGSQKTLAPICAAPSALRRTAISPKSAPSWKSRMVWWS
jgi:DNA polymerase-4